MKRIIAYTLALILASSVLPATFAFAADSAEYCVNLAVDGVNEKRLVNSTVLYNSENGKKTGTTGQGVELIVDGNGSIISVGKNNCEIPENGYVISFGSVISKNLPAIKAGDVALYDSEYKTVTIISSGYDPFGESVLNYDSINATRAENKLIIYRNKETSGTNTWGVEAVVDANGIIVSVGGNNNAIPEGGFVISGVGNKKQPITDACQLGYTAVLDEAAKTVTISYTKENAIDSYEMRIKSISEAYDKVYYSFKDIDYDAAKASMSKLDAIYKKMQTAINDGNVSEFIMLGYSFDKEVFVFNSVVVPYAPVETRTLWLRIPTSKSKATVEKTVKEIADMGFNSVCIELLFDSTTIIPMPETSLFEQNPVFAGEDMLKLYTDEFHKYGIEVHVWMSCYRVGHDASSNVKLSVGKKKPEWLNTDQNGKTSVTNEYGNAYFLNPALPEVQEFLLDTYKYILENYAVDGFQLDYVRYPENSTVNFGYDEYTKTKFLEKYNFKSVPTSSSQAGWTEWCKFRASFVTDLVKATGEMIKEIRPDVLFSCDVAPGYESTLSKMCQDTTTWLKEGLVDVIYPMAYGTTDAVEKWTNNTVELAGNSIQTVIGLRDNGAETYREQIIRARDCGADGTAFFSYSQYVVGDYREIIEGSVFSKPALCPSYNAKEAIIAQLGHTVETIDKRIVPVITEYEPKIDLSTLKAFSKKLDDLSKQLKDSDVKALAEEIQKAVDEGRSVADKYLYDDPILDNITEYLLSSLRIIEKTALNSRDAAKAKYNKSPEDVSSPDEESSDTSEETNVYVPNAFEKVFQVIFIAVMSIGLLGLPLFFFLNSRRKRIVESDKESDKEPEDNGTTEE